MRTWIIRGGSGENSVEHFINTKSIGIGYYTETDNLEGLSEGQIRAVIIHNYPKESHPSTITYFFNQVWDFVNKVAIGDQVLMPDKNGDIVHVGYVDSCYYFLECDGLPQRRNVEWTGETRPNPLPRNRDGSRKRWSKTVIDLDELLRRESSS